MLKKSMKDFKENTYSFDRRRLEESGGLRNCKEMTQKKISKELKSFRGKKKGNFQNAKVVRIKFSGPFYRPNLRKN